jgi:hypothetical protein
MQTAELQGREIIGGVNRDNAVIVVRPPLCYDEPFVAPLRVSVEVNSLRRGAVVVPDQFQRDIVCLLQLCTSEVLELFLVESELAGCGIHEAHALMSRIAAERDVARSDRMLILSTSETDA